MTAQVRDGLCRSDASYNGSLFESQILAGSKDLKDHYMCLCSKLVTKHLQREGLFSDTDHRVLVQLANSLKEVAPNNAKLQKFVNRKHTDSHTIEVDGFFSRISTQPSAEDSKAHAALKVFLQASSNDCCMIGGSFESIAKDPWVLFEGAPSHVLIEICVTGTEAVYKMFQLAKDVIVARKLRDQPTFSPLPILFLNGDIESATAAAASLDTALKRVEAEANSDVELRWLLDHLQRTCILFSPYRNVFQALKDINNEMLTKLSGVDSSIAAINSDMAEMKSNMVTHADLAAMKADMVTHADLAAMKADMATHADLDAMSAKMEDMNRQLSILVNRLVPPS
jgi:hypothetical protein